MQRMTKAERRSRRTKTAAFYRLACENDLNHRPPGNVRNRTIERARPKHRHRIERALEHAALQRRAKRALVDFLNAYFPNASVAPGEPGSDRQ